jgi:hypothetical protein
MGYKFAAHTEKKEQYKKLSSAVKTRRGKKEAISKQEEENFAFTCRL